MKNTSSNLKRRASQPAGKRPRRTGCQLGFETLEDRRLLWATYVGGGDFANNRYENGNTPNPEAVWSFTNLSYSFANLLGAWNSALMTNAQKRAAVEEAMGLWTAVTPLTFFEMTDPGTESPGALSGTSHNTGGQGDDYDPIGYPFLRWGHHNSDGAAGSVLAHARAPSDWGLGGDIHFDTGESFSVGDFMETAAHEFGHALGMAHPLGDVLDYSMPPDGIEECPGDKPAVMDACAGSYTFTGPDGSFLYDDDVAGIRSLYGAGLGYVINTGGALHIYGTAGNDLLTVNIAGGNLTARSEIIGGPFTGTFTRALNNGQTTVTSVHVHGMLGGDILRIGDNDANIPIFGYGGAGDDFLDVQQVNHNLDRATGNITFDGGDGLDFVTLFDMADPDPDAYTVTSASVTRPSFGDDFRFFYGPTTENVVLHAGMAQNVVNILSTSAAGKFYLHNGGGADVVNIGNGNSLASIFGDVEINNQPSLTTININDSAHAGAASPFFDGDTNYSWLTGAAPGDIFWRNPDTSTVNYWSGTSADTIGVVRTFRPLNLNSAGGDDQIFFGNPVQGMQGIFGNVAVSATGGAPLLTFNDLASATGRNITVQTVDAGAYQQVSGFGAGWIKFSSARSATLQLGGGSDSVLVKGLTAGVPIQVDGNVGVDALAGDDASLAEGPFRFPLYAERIERASLQYPFFNPVGFSGIDTLSYRGAANTHLYQVYGTPTLAPGEQATIVASNDLNIADSIIVYPRDASGAASIHSNVGILGGDGPDSIAIDDSASATGAGWAIYNPYGVDTQSFTVAGGGFINAFTDIEQTNLLGSQGADVFNFSSFLYGSELRVAGGNGDDSFNLGVTTPDGTPTADLEFFKPLPYFELQGGGGSDLFAIYNNSNPHSWQYLRTSAYVYVQDNEGGYFATLTSDAENVYVAGGNQANQFYVYQSPSGSSTTFASGAGADLYRIGEDSQGADGVMGVVSILPSGGSNTILVKDLAETSPTTIHVDGSQIWSPPGGNLFGEGGRVNYPGVAAEVVLQLGSGRDTVYAKPSAEKKLTLIANNPTSGPGDSLEIDLTGMLNPVVGPDPILANATRYSFDNASPVTYVGFESFATTITSGDFNADGLVNDDDLDLWDGNFGKPAGAVAGEGDADGDHDVDGFDFLAWQRQLGPVAVAAVLPATNAALTTEPPPAAAANDLAADAPASIDLRALAPGAVRPSPRVVFRAHSRADFAAADEALADFHARRFRLAGSLNEPSQHDRRPAAAMNEDSQPPAPPNRHARPLSRPHILAALDTALGQSR
ncbi:MAG: matrixin family metalloprotease [Pirellulales bacterium]|nr:matrixin family metalloprotease [Pirellulales bacterium]